MAPPISEFERQLRELEGEIKRLELEYNQFFAGRLPKLPWDSRARVEALVKQYDRMQIRNTAERFRFQGLQSRFNAFCELWERNLKNRELGRPGPMRGRAPEPVAQRAAPGTARDRDTGGAAAAAGGPVTVRDPEADAEKVRALHQEFNDARRRTGEAEVPFERFTEVVRTKVATSAGAGVTFRVREQDGRVSFTAKAAGDDSDEG